MEASKKAKLQATKASVLEKLIDLEEILKRRNDRKMNFKEACEYLGFAPSYLYKLTYRKVVPHYKPSGKVLFFSKNELDEWIFSKSNGKNEKKILMHRSTPIDTRFLNESK
jgi:excisionase family DNA binding protein